MQSAVLQAELLLVIYDLLPNVGMGPDFVFDKNSLFSTGLDRVVTRLWTEGAFLHEGMVASKKGQRHQCVEGRVSGYIVAIHVESPINRCAVVLHKTPIDLCPKINE